MTSHASDFTVAVASFVPQLATGQTCYEALQLFRSYPEAPCIVVSNSLAEPVGLVMRDRFYLQLTSRFIAYYQTDIAKLMNTSFLSIVVSSTSTPTNLDMISCLKNKAANRPAELRGDCIVMTNKQGELAGILHAPTSETAPAYA